MFINLLQKGKLKQDGNYQNKQLQRTYLIYIIII